MALVGHILTFRILDAVAHSACQYFFGTSDQLYPRCFFMAFAENDYSFVPEIVLLTRPMNVVEFRCLPQRF